GGAIPEDARLLAVADTFDAMTSNRPYRKALPVSLAYETIVSEAGKLFDPDMVNAFMTCWEQGRFHEIQLRRTQGSDEQVPAGEIDDS
ncbi:MAG: HD domain-containing phosphohydrolase, partial [Anaerolineales bacterium]